MTKVSIPPKDRRPVALAKEAEFPSCVAVLRSVGQNRRRAG